MLRTILIAAACIAVLGAEVRPAAADQEGAWCATYSVGGGGMRQDCQWRTLEECRTHIIAGDRGTCSQNPRYTGNDKKTKK